MVNIESAEEDLFGFATTGVLGKYAKLVQGAETGAITNTLE